MKGKIKKGLIALLAMCLLMVMLPMMNVAAAPPALDVITDVEYKTIQINGYDPSLAGQQTSILIMKPSFNGDFSTLFDNLDKIVAMDQVVVDADGYFTYTATLSEVEIEAGYYIFANGEANVAQVVFDEPYSVLAGEQITLPIIVKNCDNLSGLTGAVNYDEALWSFEGLSGADGFILQSLGGGFISISGDGMGVQGDAIVGYVVLTANADLTDDALTTVSFDVTKAAGADLADASVRIQSLKVNIFQSVIPGDVDLSGEVDLKDAILLLQYLSKNADLTARQLRAADVLADGDVNTADAVVIMQMCL